MTDPCLTPRSTNGYYPRIARNATFFIATARSGTQWLAANLQEIYPDLLVAEHEPVGYAYRPKELLRSPKAIDVLRSSPDVAPHLERIHQILVSKSYVEVGFPSFALFPLLLEEFHERLRIVHLIRNPVDVAASLVTHRWYSGRREDSLKSNIELTPLDPGVSQKDYADEWDSLSAFEKGLFYWTEVHLYGLEVREGHPSVPFLTLSFERLFDSTAELRRLTEFLSIPYRDELGQRIGRRIDRFRRKTSAEIEWTRVRNHLQTMGLAERLGYDLDSFEGRRIDKRYRHSEATERMRSSLSAVKRLARRMLG